MPAAERDETFDACIVGSGAGGGAAAYALCRAGWRVLVVEKGPSLGARDFIHDELAVCRRPFFLPNPLLDPNVLVVGQGSPQRGLDGWISCCVGGGTVHMSGYFFRLRAEDLRLRSTYGAVDGATLADWPIRPEELAPFYDEAERIIGVSGDAAAEGSRLRPYPLAPLLSHPAGALIDEGCAKLGVRSFRMARAIVSAEYDGRPACHYCGFCGSYGCEADAKSSTPVTFLATAARTGKLTLRAGAPVVELLATPDRRRLTGVVTQDSQGVRRRVHARVVVLAASAIQTARLLLASGLGNGSGLVGKNLMFVGQSGGSGHFPLPHPRFPPEANGLPFIDRASQDFYVARDAQLPFPKAGTLIFQRPHPNPIFQTERLAAAPAGEPPVFGATLKRRMRAYFHETRTLEYEAFAEWLPTPGTHVSLDPEVKDSLGLPAARITIAAHPATTAATRFLGAHGRAILEAAGATGVSDDLPAGPAARAGAYPFLQAGTTRMGHHPRDSVLDPSCRAHELENLYVADASSFPSAGGAPHTLTIMANALRVASHIASRGRAGTI
jgi:choline dehydrogenase-like flavoprotein